MADPQDPDEWQFGLDDVGPEGILTQELEPLEPGSPDLENVLFVLLGIAGTLFLLYTALAPI